MLTFFPELLFLAPFSALLIRVSLALVFATSAAIRIKSPEGTLKIFGAIDAVIAVFLFIGLSTQLAALAALVCTIAWLTKESLRPFPKSTVLLALVMCVSLLVTGAGPLALDLPL